MKEFSSITLSYRWNPIWQEKEEIHNLQPDLVFGKFQWNYVRNLFFPSPDQTYIQKTDVCFEKTSRVYVLPISIRFSQTISIPKQKKSSQFSFFPDTNWF